MPFRPSLLFLSGASGTSGPVVLPVLPSGMSVGTSTGVTLPLLVVLPFLPRLPLLPFFPFLFLSGASGTSGIVGPSHSLTQPGNSTPTGFLPPFAASPPRFPQMSFKASDVFFNVKKVLAAAVRASKPATNEVNGFSFINFTNEPIVPRMSASAIFSTKPRTFLKKFRPLLKIDIANFGFKSIAPPAIVVSNVALSLTSLLVLS